MIPILRELEFDYLEKDVDGPRKAVEELARMSGLDIQALYVPKIAILSLSVGITELLAKRFGAREAPWIYRARPLYIGSANGVDVGIIWASPGAPLAAMVMEHLIACGAKCILGIGLIATIDPRIEVGTLIIPTKAIRGEGTSYYYLPEDIDAIPSEEVVAAIERACKELGVKYTKGPIYTTAAIHRETRKLIEALRSRGVLGIDMETSAIFAVGIYRKIKTGCILVTSTNVSRMRSIGFYSETLKESISEAIEVLKEAIKSIAL